MKKHLLFYLLFLFHLISTNAQKKDTLFFSTDKYYTISPTIDYNISNRNYSQLEEVHIKQKKHTKTNGYVYFIGNVNLAKNLKPKKILSIKDYIENKKFYFDGTYNKIIDKWKLQDSLINKYKIYFVNGNEFVEAKYIEYHSYYPLKKGKKTVYNKVKDTLYFKLDNEYVYQSQEDSKLYFLKDSNKNESFFLKENEIKKNLKPINEISLKEFVQSSRFFNRDKIEGKKLNEKDLADYLSNYVVFVIDKNNSDTKYIHVDAGIIIYD